MKHLLQKYFTTDEYITNREEIMIIVMAILSAVMFLDSIMHGQVFTNALAGWIR